MEDWSDLGRVARKTDPARIDEIIRGAGWEITDGRRTPAQNRAVKGAARSYHLTDQARDLRLKPGLDEAAVRRVFADNGVPIRELLGPWNDPKGHGDHVHVAFDHMAFDPPSPAPKPRKGIIGGPPRTVQASVLPVSSPAGGGGESWADLGVVVPEMRQKPRSLGERFTENIADGFQYGGLAQLGRQAFPDGTIASGFTTPPVQIIEGGLGDRGLDALLGPNRNILRSVPDTPSPVAVAERDRRELAILRGQGDPWNRAPGGPIGQAAAGASTLTGQFVGNALSPESWAGIGKGLSLPQNMLRNAGANVALDTGLQVNDMGAGVQDGFEPVRTAASAALGAGIPAVVAAGSRGVNAIRNRVAASVREAPTDLRMTDDWSDLGRVEPEAPSPAARTEPEWVEFEGGRIKVGPNGEVLEIEVTKGADSPNAGPAQPADRQTLDGAGPPTSRGGDSDGEGLPPGWAGRGGVDPARIAASAERFEQLRRENPYGDQTFADEVARERLTGETSQLDAYFRDELDRINANRADGSDSLTRTYIARQNAMERWRRWRRVQDDLADRRTRQEARQQPAAPRSPDDWSDLGQPAQQASQAAMDVLPPVRTPEPAQAAPAVPHAAPESSLASFRPVKPAKVYPPSGEPLDATYGVVDVRDLIASHGLDLNPNPRFPAELQPRDRTRAASEAQIAEIASRLQPERLGESPDATTGAPIIGRDGVVESGNARTIALSRLYETRDPNAESYRAFLKAQGYPVDGIERPVLVRRRDTELDTRSRVDWTSAANERQTAAMSPAEQAKVDAGKLTADLLDSYRGGGLELEANAPFVSRALANLTTAADRGGLVDANGRISAAGVARIRAAMTAKAYDDAALVSRLYEDARPELGTLGKAAQDAAPAWAGMRAAAADGAIPRELDATKALTEALALMQQAREGKVRLAEAFTTQDAFGGRDPRVEQFVRLFHHNDRFGRVRSGAAIQADLEAYARSARAAASGNLFGESGSAQSGAILDGLIRKARDAEAKKLTDAPLETLMGARGGRLGVRSGDGPPPPSSRSLASLKAEMEARGVRLRIEGDGPGGVILRGLEGRWTDAVDVLRTLQQGDARAVLSHPETGPIDVIWGNEKGGLRHILDKHPEVVADLPERLANMRVVRRPTANRINLGDGNGRAVVRLDYDGQAKTWLLTAFEEESGRGLGGRTESANPDGRARSPDQPANPDIARSADDWSDLGLRLDPNSPLASRGAGLRGQLRPGANPSGSVVGGAAYQGQRVSQLAQRLIASMGLTVRAKRLSLKGALGQYDPNSGVIRSRVMQEIDVLAHEGGHALDFKRLPALDAATSKHARLLAGLAYPGAPQNVLREEGFAEFFRWYVTNPTHARKVGGGFYADFEAALAKDNPSLLRDLKAIQSEYQAFLAAPSAAAVSASVVTTKRRQGFREFMRSAADDFGSAANRLADDVYTALVDDLHPINTAVRELQKIMAANQGRRLDLQAAKNPYALARLSRDAYASGHMDLMHGVRPYGGVDPEGPALSDALAKALGDKFLRWDDQRITDFGGYLVSRRMVFEWGRYDRGEIPNPPDKLSLDAHKQAIADFERANPTWDDAAKLVYDWNQRLWKKEYDAGLITRAQYDAGLAIKDYVPLMRDLSDLERTGARPVAGPGKFAGGVRRFKGSTRDVINPIQSMMRRSYELAGLIARNDAFKALDDMGQVAGPGAGAIVERVPASEMRAFDVDALEVLERAAKDAGVAPRDLTVMMDAVDTMLAGETSVKVFRPGEINEKGEPIVFVWRKGKRVPLRLADGPFGRQLYTALTGMNEVQKSLFVDAMAAPTQMLRLGITSHPEFLATNFIRDQLTTWINTDVGFKPFLSGAIGVGREMRQGVTSRRYNSFGGPMGGANVAALADGRINQDINALRKKGYAIRRFSGLTGFTKLTEFSETGTRFGLFDLAFKQAKKDGLSDHDAAVEAAFAARDVIDFRRQGSKMIAARRVFTFLNAAIQGLDKTTRVLTADGNMHRVLAPFGKGAPQTPGEKRALQHAYKAWAKIVTLGVLGLGLRALYADDPEYEEISDYLRATHWMVKLDGHWTAIPKPFEQAIVSNILERAYESQARGDPTAWSRLAKDLYQTVVPPHEIPALAVPFQIARNRDHQKRPIVPDHLNGTVDPHLQFNSWTSEFGRWLGQKVGVSPAVIDHMVTGFGGSWGREFLAASNIAREAPTDEGLEDRFMTRRFVRDVTRSSTSQAEFWRLVARDGDFSKGEGTFRRLVKDGDDPKALAYLKGLSKPERDYVLASVFLSNRGDQRLRSSHPLVRAQEAGKVISDLQMDLRLGKQTDLLGNPILLTPTQRKQADDALAQLRMAEMRNGLIAAEVRGWAQKAMIPRQDALRRLHTASPALQAALKQRMAAERVVEVDFASQNWSRARALLRGANDEQLRRLMRGERMSTTPGKLQEIGRAVRARRGEAAPRNALAGARQGNVVAQPRLRNALAGD